MVRYSILHEKNPREIVLLRGTGCRWRKCTFCDYHLDSSPDEAENWRLNQEVLQQVTGCYHHLEVINSGSFPELDSRTMKALRDLCREKAIRTLHFECHWLYREEIPALRAAFGAVGTTLKIKTGVETFDRDFREKVLRKGIPEEDQPGSPGSLTSAACSSASPGRRRRVCAGIWKPALPILSGSASIFS